MSTKSTKKISKRASLCFAWAMTFASFFTSFAVLVPLNVSFAAGVAKDISKDADLPEIRRRRLPEYNGVADFLCSFVLLMQSDISRALVSFSLFAAGIGAFFGKLNVGWFMSFAVGAAVFFGSISLLGFFAPYSDVAMGCNCKTYIVVGRNPDGGYVKISSMLDKNCQRKDDPQDENLPSAIVGANGNPSSGSSSGSNP